MRKKLVGTLLIAAMTASTLAGCGSSNSTAGTSASGGAAETSPAESATEAEGKMQQMAKKFLLYGAGIQPSMYMQ